MRILKVTAITALLCIGLLAATAFPVGAQQAPGPDNSGEHVKGYDDWHFSFGLGEWVPAFQGVVTAKGGLPRSMLALTMNFNHLMLSCSYSVGTSR